MHFLDTNILLYYLFSVDKRKHEACKGLLTAAEAGKVDLWTSEWVIAELVWFLTNMKYPWPRIREIVEIVITAKGIVVRGREWIWAVLDECGDGIGFMDAVNVRIIREAGGGEVYSYDKGLDRLGGFKRIEP